MDKYIATPDIRVTIAIRAESEDAAEKIIKAKMAELAKMLSALEGIEAKGPGYISATRIPESTAKVEVGE